ncbi:unnamed protein product [Haemonchus placei]|uniref:HTH_48 domain-containing protein n=1 Tax=Haemonchus placei TaxID=6290 RepID=A0A0N4WJG9_HAEPC|nr:unnamed protein product [Haemonchus placei]
MLHDFKPSQLHLRNNILFLFLSGQGPAAIDRRLEEIHKEEAPVRSALCKWHSKFASGDCSIEDGNFPGSTMDLDLDVLRSHVEADPYQTTRELTVTLGVSQSTAVRGLKSIGKVRKLGRWVPHAWEQYDMDQCANVALSLLTLRRIHTWLEHPVTRNEEWILYFDVHWRAQRVDKGADAGGFPNSNVPTIVCSASGRAFTVSNTGNWDKGYTVTADVYIRQLRNSKANLEVSRPQQHKVYLQQTTLGRTLQERPNRINEFRLDTFITCTIFTRLGSLAMPPFSPSPTSSEWTRPSDPQRHQNGTRAILRTSTERSGAGVSTICPSVARRPSMPMGHISNDSLLSFKNCKIKIIIVNWPDD